MVVGPRARPTLVVAAVFGINYVETMIESIVRDRLGWGVDLGNQLAAAFRGLEGNLSFESHDVTNWLAVYGYSVAYFFVLPAIGLAAAVVLWRREDVHAYRILCLSIAADYLISLGFFLFFPVPERWSYADSGAILLSDRWSSRLIELVRPISAMDNCFPSTHVSLTVVLILVGYLSGLRWRHTICALGKRRPIDVRPWDPLAAGHRGGRCGRRPQRGLGTLCRGSSGQGAVRRGSRWSRRGLASVAGASESTGSLVALPLHTSMSV
jgi:hypothetical protein